MCLWLVSFSWKAKYQHGFGERTGRRWMPGLLLSRWRQAFCRARKMFDTLVAFPVVWSGALWLRSLVFCFEKNVVVVIKKRRHLFSTGPIFLLFHFAAEVGHGWSFLLATFRQFTRADGISVALFGFVVRVSVAGASFLAWRDSTRFCRHVLLASCYTHVCTFDALLKPETMRAPVSCYKMLCTNSAHRIIVFYILQPLMTCLITIECIRCVVCRACCNVINVSCKQKNGSLWVGT